MKRMLIRLGSALILVAMLCSCSVVADHTDETTLRAKYNAQTVGVSKDDLYWSVMKTTVGWGIVLNSIPGFHVPGVFIDLGIVVDNFDSMIYGMGAIVAREHSCPLLVGDGDFYGVSGAWFRGVRSAPELEMAIGLASASFGVLTNAERAAKFMAAAQTHGLPILGPKLSSILLGKVGIKWLTSIAPILGPIIAGGINYFIFDRLNDAAIAYYEAKAEHVCKPVNKRPDIKASPK